MRQLRLAAPGSRRILILGRSASAVTLCGRFVPDDYHSAQMQCLSALSCVLDDLLNI